MALQLADLDTRTRAFMLDELDRDLARNQLYLSPRLSDRGRTDYPDLLRQAITHGTDDTLAAGLQSLGRINQTEYRRRPNGGQSIVDVPVTAPITLADGEFNRYYARGLCRRAIEDQIAEVVIYRAKAVENPRAQSQAMLGRRLDPQALLADLRSHQGVEPALGLPPGPNSGLSVRLP